MFILPAILLLQKKFIDLTDQENIDLVRTVLISVVAVVCGVYFIIYQMVSSKKAGSDKKIWVPPKPEPAMPFSAPPAPPTPEQYVETTYYDHEMAMVVDAVKAMGMPIGIALFMSFKFNIHVSSLAQIFQLPLTTFENPLVKKYILGMKADYKELTEAPVSEGTQTAGDSSAAPRVEEISEEEFKRLQKKQGKSKKGKAAKVEDDDEGEETDTKPEIADPNDID